METIKKIGWADLGSWWATLASLFPLWLISLAVMSEGFPKPFLSPGLALSALILALAVSVVLLWKVWLTFELLLYSLFPFILLFLFDEISTRYKTPFILLCALLLTIGIIGYQRSLSKDSIKVGWLILLVVFVGTWILAFHAAQNYWHLAGDFCGACFPDGSGQNDLAFTGHEAPWWILFFSS
jgi:hypothetical protein